MAAYDFSSTRLFVDAALAEGREVALGDSQANYVRNVMRMAAGDGLLLFNGRDGEWGARIAEVAKKRVVLVAERRLREQTPPGRLRYLFAPLKHARLDYMVQKAVEMGASRLSPVITRRTQAARVNLDRMRANAIEAAEQCGVLAIPEVDEPAPLARVLDGWPEADAFVFCDEDACAGDPLAPLTALRGRPVAVLIGPEGGFDPEERARLLRLPSIVRLTLGPRILRADTAAVAALALVQAVAGDWRV
ncbi:MAG TPA: 16S rRNA (uracil(1498)-N(3))-methyltransferase [Hansschlegelia sp.]